MLNIKYKHIFVNILNRKRFLYIVIIFRVLRLTSFFDQINANLVRWYKMVL